jgi:hypothetical protein
MAIEDNADDLPVAAPDLNGIMWSGCWETRPGRHVCRWMLAWVKTDDAYVGCIAGYSGGGAFQLEKFVVIDGHSVTSDQPEFSELSTDLIALAEDCQDVVLSFHSEDEWFDSDTLHLDGSRQKALEKKDDLLFGGALVAKELAQLFELVGLISRPEAYAQS